MTREAAITELNTFKRLAKSESGEKALDMAIEALKLIPDNAINGDVIKALFPQGEAVVRGGVIDFNVDGYTWYSAYAGWWNAPYRKE